MRGDEEAKREIYPNQSSTRACKTARKDTVEWRKQHEQLVAMTGPTKGLGGVGMEVGGMDMEEEVKEAYEVVKRIDVLDISVGVDFVVSAFRSKSLMLMGCRGYGDLGYG